MPWRRMRAPEWTGQRQEGSETDLAPEPFATSDQVLLCCFGLDQSTQRSSTQLRSALVEAGFTAPAAREIVRISPLIHRSYAGSYQLRHQNRERSVP
jgi:hypothetical protein